MKPKTLILRTAGVNCDQDTPHAFALAGATPEFLHVNQLLQPPALMSDYQPLAIPGASSSGDDTAAGRTRSNRCIWPAGIDRLELPIAHGEGKFGPADDAVRQALWDNGQVALVYTRPDGAPAAGQFPENPNGSIDDIAGICDASGLVFGLMPHPERHVSPLQHPAWTRFAKLPEEGAGLRVFRNAVSHVRDAVGAGA